MELKYPALFTIGIVTAIVLSLLVTGQLSGSEKNPLERKVDLLIELMGNSTKNVFPKASLMGYFLESFEDKEASDIVQVREISSIYLWKIKGEKGNLLLIFDKWVKIE